jgi:hypothetical protein
MIALITLQSSGVAAISASTLIPRSLIHSVMVLTRSTALAS